MKTQIVASLLILFTSNLSIPQERRDFADVPTVVYCNLVQNAASYDKQVVRVRAVYIVGFEGSLFRDTSCEDKAAWVKFDPSFEKNTKRKILKSFRRLSDASPVKTPNGGINHPVREVEILAVGRFDGVKPTYQLGKRTLSSGFGHLNSYDYQFTVLSVEEVKAIPKSASTQTGLLN